MEDVTSEKRMTTKKGAYDYRNKVSIGKYITMGN